MFIDPRCLALAEDFHRPGRSLGIWRDQNKLRVALELPGVSLDLRFWQIVVCESRSKGASGSRKIPFPNSLNGNGSGDKYRADGSRTAVGGPFRNCRLIKHGILKPPPQDARRHGPNSGRQRIFRPLADGFSSCSSSLLGSNPGVRPAVLSLSMNL